MIIIVAINTHVHAYKFQEEPEDNWGYIAVSYYWADCKMRYTHFLWLVWGDMNNTHIIPFPP